MATYTVSADTPILINTTISEDTIIIEDKAVVKAVLSYTDNTKTVSVKGLFKEFGFGNEFVNSYVTLEEADDYLNLIFTDWDELTEAVKLKHLLSGTRYIEREFSFVGEKKRDVQALSFPRQGCETIPYNLKKACIEAAYLDFKENLNPLSTTQQEKIKDVVEESEKIGPITITTKYNKGQEIIEGGQKESKTYNSLKGLLGDLVSRPSQVTRLRVDNAI